jgi:hypothetical protein
VCDNSIRPRRVVKEFHDVITYKHMLGTDDKLTVGPARVISEALFPIGPVRNKNHKLVADQQGHTVDVNQNVYTQTSLKS